MQWSSRRFTLVALLLLIPSADAWAQLATAQMNGRVTDPSGAVLPGVAITATQTDTGATRTVVTDDRGAYALPNLPTGPYRLESMLSGFRTYVQTGIVLQVAGTPVINIVLALGNLEEAVTVDAAAPLVDVKSAGIGTVIENERILELPLQGRQVTDLILLAGAAVQTGQPNTRSFQGGVNIAVAGRGSAWPTSSTARCTTIPRLRPACRCRSRMRCRNSGWPRAASRPRTAFTRVRRSMQ